MEPDERIFETPGTGPLAGLFSDQIENLLLRVVLADQNRQGGAWLRSRTGGSAGSARD